MKLLLLGGYRFVGRAVIAEAQARDDPSALRGRQWDFAVDTSGYVPRHVRAAAEALRDTVQRYVFVSSLSVYAEYAPGLDESHPLQRRALVRTRPCSRSNATVS